MEKRTLVLGLILLMSSVMAAPLHLLT